MSFIPPLPSMQLNPFHNSGISAKHNKVEGFQPIAKSLIRGLFHYCKISFTLSLML